MPRLPSGRNIALDASPFDDLIEQARTGHNAALLLSIRRLRHILPLFQVIEVEERPDIPAEELPKPRHSFAQGLSPQTPVLATTRRGESGLFAKPLERAGSESGH
ncbi:MAG: hypothetical protein ACKOJB_12845 [Chthoniobacterales bacterium]